MMSIKTRTVQNGPIWPTWLKQSVLDSEWQYMALFVHHVLVFKYC